MAARLKTSPSVKRLVEEFGLQPHPEGGFFRESYRSSELVPTPRGQRSACTAIYFLLPEGSKSRLHRIKSDELWHYYLGGPLEIIELLEDGSEQKTILGRARGQKLQHVVPAGRWFGAKPKRGAGYCFVGCTVAPGFDFRDFELLEKGLDSTRTSPVK